MSQTEFADATGWSLSRISNLESRRSNISGEVLVRYKRALRCNEEEEQELRKLAEFSNEMRRRSNEADTHVPLQTMLNQFGHKVSPEAANEIKSILERETGEQVGALTFWSNASNEKENNRIQFKRKTVRPVVLPYRLAEIALQALDLRRKVSTDREKLDITRLLQFLVHSDERFDYQIGEKLPDGLKGAFAAILGHSEGTTLIIEEDRFSAALKGVHFARHVICHEIGHYLLHPYLLKSDAPLFLPPQELAKNSLSLIDSDRQIEQVVETLVEAEAECFATFLLVPWEVFLHTDPYYLAKDYGEQQREIERYARYFKNPALVDEFKTILWETGQKSHEIFQNRIAGE